MKKLFISICLVAVTAVMLATSTFAWFSMSMTVDATGMGVQAETTGSLVISANTPVGTEQHYIITQPAQKIKPATYNAGAAGSLLQAPNSDTVYDPQTGLVVGTETMVTVTSTDYYTDFTMFIASAGDAITGKELWVSFDGTTKQYIKEHLQGFRITRSAVSAMVFCETGKRTGDPFVPSESNLKGILELDNRASQVKILTSSDSIPKNTDATAIRVVFRVYIDGAATCQYERITHYVAGYSYYTYNETTGAYALAGTQPTDESQVTTGEYYINTSSMNVYRQSGPTKEDGYTYVNPTFTQITSGKVNAQNFDILRKYIYVREGDVYKNPTGEYAAATYYYEVTGDTPVSSPDESNMTQYWIRLPRNAAYVYTNSVDTDLLTFGVVFKVTAPGA